MTEVVVIAGIVAYYRAAISASVMLRVGAWCYFAVAIFSFIADRALDRRAVWNAILRDHTSAPVRHLASCGICEMAREHAAAGRSLSALRRARSTAIAPRFIPAVAAVAAAIPLLLPGVRLLVHGERPHHRSVGAHRPRHRAAAGRPRLLAVRRRSC